MKITSVFLTLGLFSAIPATAEDVLGSADEGQPNAAKAIPATFLAQLDVVVGQDVEIDCRDPDFREENPEVCKGLLSEDTPNVDAAAQAAAQGEGPGPGPGPNQGPAQSNGQGNSDLAGTDAGQGPKGNNGIGTAGKNDNGDPPGGGNTGNDGN